jgi:hypothetical protein
MTFQSTSYSPLDTDGFSTLLAGKRLAPVFDRSNGTPKQVHVQNRLAVLRVVDRFRQVRTLDVAAALFANRTFKAALTASQRTVSGLLRDKMLTRYRSDSGHTYYGLAEKGARLLRDNAAENLADGSAQASASRACEKTNPEHALWSAFVVAASESRGLVALTERELAARFFTRDKTNKLVRRAPLSYIPAGSKQAKGLMPDALAWHEESLVWFEVDRSTRGSTRMEDLLALVRKLGESVRVGDEPARSLDTVVIFCKTPAALRRNRTHMLGTPSNSDKPRLRMSEGNKCALEQVDESTYRLLKETLVLDADGVREQLAVRVVGQVKLQLLPTWLSSYSYEDGAPEGWFDSGSLPFKASWPAMPER